MGSIRPVHELTPAEAVQELEQLLDAEEPINPHARAAFRQRRTELEAWILMHPRPAAPGPTEQEPEPIDVEVVISEPAPVHEPTPAPSQTQETPMPKPAITTLSEKLKRLHERYESAPSNRRGRIAWEARAICRQEGIPVPEWARRQNAQHQVQEPAPARGPIDPADFVPIPAPGAVRQVIEVPITFTEDPALTSPSPTSRLQAAQALVAELLRDALTLPPEERAELLAEAGNLDALAHLLATFLATGRIEVAA